MTREQTKAQQADNRVIETVVQLLSENGLLQLAEADAHEAMRIERSQALEADSYRRTEKCRAVTPTASKPRRCTQG